MLDKLQVNHEFFMTINGIVKVSFVVASQLTRPQVTFWWIQSIHRHSTVLEVKLFICIVQMKTFQLMWGTWRYIDVNVSLEFHYCKIKMYSQQTLFDLEITLNEIIGEWYLHVITRTYGFGTHTLICIADRFIHIFSQGYVCSPKKKKGFDLFISGQKCI